jgi:general secretion pathway protein A
LGASYLVWENLQQPVIHQQDEAAVTPPVAEDPVPPPPADGLDPDWLLRQHRSAWTSLARAWDDPASATKLQQACDGVAGTGYACLKEQGNWSRIRQLGLPVLLVLQAESPLLLPLRGMAAGKVTVGDVTEEREVGTDEIESRWFGDYIVVWPQAPGWPNEIRRGESGEAVDIVMAMAAYAEPPWQGSGVFDANFESWLKAFQRRHGLEADGIVGPNTLIYLMAPTIDRPRLRLDNQGSS